MAQNRFPEELIHLKQAQIRTYNRLVQRPPTGAEALRSELTLLSLQVRSHPHWHGRRPSARELVDLQRQAEAAPGGESELIVEFRDGAFTVRPPTATRPAASS
ncbi:hypothetical protein [Streptomyces sp. NBC_00162]|uniref:hypothetical protein n=1 Tax=Streptomyces sp. NBC_00162 TaxID=2903629 RepID=UPI00214B36F1|nr:hypothetical protein [Streptomyces sp. NBC_00162]UUU37666.1 hypothetical protein JIW86_01280 [Streptomyces sp. NBC_00162]